MEMTTLRAAATDCLHVVIAYGDAAAYQRALHLLARTLGRMQHDIDVRPLPWPFTALESQNWQRYAREDVGHADIVIVAATDPGPLPETVRTWMRSSCATRRGSSVLVVALFGPPGLAAEPRHPACEFIRRIAHGAGLPFLTPGGAEEYTAIGA